jgi:probable rRNA maturation factor
VQSRPEIYAAWAETVRRVLEAGLTHLNLADAEVSVLLTDDAGIAALNAQYRGRPEPTDVLSFAQREGEGADPADPVLGDIVISVERAARQAEEYGHSLAREVAFLAVHGLLHLLGYDHETPADEAEMMRETEAILAPLGLTR